MNKENIKEGMKVRVSNDLTKTKEMWSLDHDGVMLTMRGKTFKVDSVGFESISIDRFAFCAEDLQPTLLKKFKPHKPVMFDPKNIDVGT